MLFTLSVFWAAFKTLTQLLPVFIRVSGSFIDFDTSFKALIHFLKLQLGKI